MALREPIYREPSLEKRPTNWFNMLTQIKERPGEWAEVSVRKTRRSATATICNLRRENGPYSVPSGRFEFTYDVHGNQYPILARYLGE